MESKHMCCIQLSKDIGYIYLSNVYISNDTVNNINLHEYLICLYSSKLMMLLTV